MAFLCLKALKEPLGDFKSLRWSDLSYGTVQSLIGFLSVTDLM
jgi:hypothetical protein